MKCILGVPAAFICHDRYRTVCSNVFQSFKVKTWNWLLNQFNIIFIQTADQFNGLFCLPSLICIKTDLRSVSYRFTDCTYSRKICCEINTDLRFNYIKACFYVLSCTLCHNLRLINSNSHVGLDLIGKSAKNLVKRKTCFLSQNIMTSKVNCCLCTAIISNRTVHNSPDSFHITRIHTDQFFFKTLNGCNRSFQIFAGNQRTR